MLSPVLKTNNKTSVNRIRQTLLPAIVLVLLFTNSFADGSKKVKTASYSDLAVYVTHTLGSVVPAAQNSDISAQISAIINTFHVDTGSEVKQGDLLVSLDCAENLLKLKQAEALLRAEKAQLKHAITKFSQAEKLDKQGNISKELYNQRLAEESRLRAMVESRKFARQLAQINVNRCQVKAPFDGYVTRRNASIGELTRPGSSLLRLVSKTNHFVEVKINNRLLHSFTHGKNYRYIFNDKSYALKIDLVIPVMDRASRNHLARLTFVDEHAITGSVGRLQWQDTEASIPSAYIVSRDNRLGILIAENASAKFIAIDNAVEGQPAKIKLDDNTQIITRGRFNIKPGDTLLVDNE